ncbi:MAG: MBL fold metallo-hydrolase [Clostridia bacterium]|nr:MBL fold metallo-hydrolase [Clostridia bacterium]
MRFCSLASGSSGNSYYIGTKNTNILIDAGISGKRICQELESKVGLEGSQLDGLFITHEHTDHIQSIGVLARRFKVPLYATEGTWRGMRGKIGEVDPDLCHVLDDCGSLELGDINIEWFPTSHDANEPVGYLCQSGKKKIGLATDTGVLTRPMADILRNVDLLVLEANHDEKMLATGRYPLYLKKRIGSSLGHLSNRAAGKALLDLAGEKTKTVFLAHLSQENNLPGLAMATVGEILSKNKVEFNFDLAVAPRSQSTSCIRL